MKRTIINKILIVLLAFFTFPFATIIGYGFWDVQAYSQSETVTSGSWTFYYVNYDFSVDTLTTIQADGALSTSFSRWTTDNGSLESTSKSAAVYFPYTTTDYIVTSTATLSATYTAYGISFETVLSSNISKDNGYSLRFDPSRNDGSIYVLERTNGRDRSTIWQVTSSSSSALPSYSSNPTWWTSEHTISIEVSSLTSTTKQAIISIDGTQIGSFTFSAMSGTTYYAGLYAPNSNLSASSFSVALNQ